MEHSKESEQALIGMKRAAQLARERALRYGLKIPVWKDGKVTFEEVCKRTIESQNRVH